MIILLEDEADAFWCFERLMHKLVFCCHLPLLLVNVQQDHTVMSDTGEEWKWLHLVGNEYIIYFPTCVIVIYFANECFERMSELKE